jgi:DNA gyrase subunit B
VRALLGHGADYERLLQNLALRRIDERVVDAAVSAGMPRGDDLTDAEHLRDFVSGSINAELATSHPDALPVVWSVEDDREHGGFRLVGETRRAGVVYRTRFDADFLRSPDFHRLVTLSTQMAEIGRAPFHVRGGNDEDEPVPTPVALLQRILELGKKGLSIQRYKGLGEMNPDQLSETTMDPTRRTLLQVRIEDAVEADLVFSTLMGDEVEPRREFIERNALAAQNLDI